ncbi:LacI family DNA-binding transcriptional regulator [Tepidibacillus sp. HK-1]|uniref:LacI family DNA-binding transcriptional regulator n=1 Tax=Tepidibacillus sp. HK-1 TaxID=1883407 RepID=UPI000853D024|nr:LacI family DNA-binding transcriptional regulator [Tepidibacillus sp. HK-1]
MITINEIAKLANVSRTTVSRVLNNSGYVSDEARTRVLKVIKETGYIPSHQAKSLRTKQTKVIGVILPKISTDTSSRIVSGMDEVFSEKGYQILLANTNLKNEKEIEYLNLLKSRRVDGIILLATNINENLVNEIKHINIPFVAVGQEILHCSYIVHDDYNAAKTITNILIEKGRKNIAFIGVYELDYSVGVLRKQGYYDALKENGLPIQPSYISIRDFKLESGYKAMEEIAKNNNVFPDGVFAATHRLAIGAMQYLKEKNMKIPDEISVAGIGDSDLSKIYSPALTTIDLEYEEAGRKAAKILLWQIEGKKVHEQKITLGYRLIERDSI